MPSAFEKCLNGECFDGSDKELRAMTVRAKRLLARLRATDYDDEISRLEIFRDLFGSVGDGVHIDIDFRCEYGKTIFIGNNVEINMGCTFVDNGRIIIGDNVLIASDVRILTATHPVKYSERMPDYGKCNTIARSVIIEDGAWIGAGAILLPGIVVGRRAVIGAGSVVTRSIPGDTVAAGNPCRVLRKIE